ncbi:hypothetical protein RND81_01G159300 [Saponaria officinalis]|uniref:Uncharacterized protein n=1 Tax=Saponaria officinalis TaxID=3572 RepID=A0AAW1NG99_SAPOF
MAQLPTVVLVFMTMNETWTMYTHCEWMNAYMDYFKKTNDPAYSNPHIRGYALVRSLPTDGEWGEIRGMFLEQFEEHRSDGVLPDWLDFESLATRFTDLESYWAAYYAVQPTPPVAPTIQKEPPMVVEQVHPSNPAVRWVRIGVRLTRV